MSIYNLSSPCLNGPSFFSYFFNESDKNVRAFRSKTVKLSLPKVDKQASCLLCHRGNPVFLLYYFCILVLVIAQKYRHRLCPKATHSLQPQTPCRRVGHRLPILSYQCRKSCGSNRSPYRNLYELS